MRSHGAVLQQAPPPGHGARGDGLIVGASLSSHSSAAPALPDFPLATKQLRAMFEDYARLVAEATPLSEAMEMVTDKLRLMRAPARSDGGRGPVHAALARHPGALEAIVAGLVGRMEGFLDEARMLYSRFDAQHLQAGEALTRWRVAVQLWLNRYELGAEVSLHEADEISQSDEDTADGDPSSAARAVLAAIDDVEEDLHALRAGTTEGCYLDPAVGVPKWTRKTVDVPSVLEGLDVLSATALAASQHKKSVTGKVRR